MDIAPVSRDTLVSRDTSSHFMKLTVRQPRIARRRGNHVISRHPINQEFEEQLSKQFYFQQSEHGPVSAVYHCGKDKPEIIGIKKGEVLVSFPFILGIHVQPILSENRLPTTRTSLS